MIAKCFNYIMDIIVRARHIVLFYLGWVFIHYLCSQLYIYFCAPFTLYGLIMSPFLIMTPHCNAFRWVIYEAGKVLYGMWIAIGSWTIANILTLKQ